MLELEPLLVASSKAIRGDLHVYSIYRLTSLGVFAANFLEHLLNGIDAYYD